MKLFIAICLKVSDFFPICSQLTLDINYTMMERKSLSYNIVCYKSGSLYIYHHSSISLGCVVSIIFVMKFNMCEKNNVEL